MLFQRTQIQFPVQHGSESAVTQIPEKPTHSFEPCGTRHTHSTDMKAKHSFTKNKVSIKKLYWPLPMDGRVDIENIILIWYRPCHFFLNFSLPLHSMSCCPQGLVTSVTFFVASVNSFLALALLYFLSSPFMVHVLTEWSCGLYHRISSISFLNELLVIYLSLHTSILPYQACCSPSIGTWFLYDSVTIGQDLPSPLPSISGCCKVQRFLTFFLFFSFSFLKSISHFPLTFQFQ